MSSHYADKSQVKSNATKIIYMSLHMMHNRIIFGGFYEV